MVKKYPQEIPETPDDMVRMLYQVIIGLPDNSQDNGMIGDVKEILKHLETLNGQVHTNTTFRKIGTFISCSIVIAMLGLLAKFWMW